MDPEISVLTSTVATTVVQLLAMAPWKRAASAFGGLWRRVHSERPETVPAELEDSRTELLAAWQVGDEQVEQALIGGWQGRLRHLVAADTQLVDKLRRVAESRSTLADTDPPQGTTIAMQATTFGNSQANHAARDPHVSPGE